MQQCTQCKKWLSVEKFEEKKPGILYQWCKYCRATRKRWEKTNVQHLRKYWSEYAKIHKERKARLHTEWAKKNPDKVNNAKTRARVRQYYREHKEEKKRSLREWSRKNSDKRSEYKKVRRAKKRANGGGITTLTWRAIKKMANFSCSACNRSEPEIKLTIDHIVPVSKGGSGNADNIQPLCLSCNSSKHAKIKDYRPIFIRTKLEELLP